MAKRIVFCADGTWQTPLSGTNVYKLYKALAISADQVTYYDDGVGADAQGFDRIVQGSIGEGLLEKITAAYTKIAHAYEDGDEIYLFGFSRGAYTVRSLAGFIATCGLPSGPVIDDCVAKAFAAYRDPTNRAAMLAELGACGLSKAPIRMIGVWDTVGAMGIPAIFGGFDVEQYGFLDTSLHPDVHSAYQCLAVDEQRRQFPATLWTSAPVGDQVIEQVWFSGCHGDVGGGTPPGVGVDTTRLCDITLGWMISKALFQGLAIDPAVVATYSGLEEECAFDRYIDSWAGMPVGPPLARTIPAGSSIANSVALRIEYGVGSYLPGNLTLVDQLLATDYSLVNVVSAT